MAPNEDQNIVTPTQVEVETKDVSVQEAEVVTTESAILPETEVAVVEVEQPLPSEQEDPQEVISPEESPTEVIPKEATEPEVQVSPSENQEVQSDEKAEDQTSGDAGGDEAAFEKEELAKRVIDKIKTYKLSNRERLIANKGGSITRHVFGEAIPTGWFDLTLAEGENPSCKLEGYLKFLG